MKAGSRRPTNAMLTTTVDNIDTLSPTTVNGQAMIKIFLQPNCEP